MSRESAERRRAERAQRQHEARRQKMRIAGVAVAAIATIIFVLVTAGGDTEAPETAGPAGVMSFEDLSRNHVDGAVEYAQIPPVGGDHAAVWQNCGAYGQPIVTEYGVHSLEHGAVWITYRDNLAEPDEAELRQLAVGQPYVLVTPWPDGLPTPVVASAWGRQLRAESVSDPRLREFIRAFQEGPQSPEPGAPCTGGQGTPT